MNVSFVRALAMLWAYEDLEGTGALDNAGDVRRRFIVFVMRFVALVICFAGTMYVLEVLGDHYWVQDTFVEAEMGPVSFYQMCYFIFITISTVGYGDFAPKTLLGRAFVVVVIISGVAFFSIETAELLRLGRAEASGLGSLKRRGRGRAGMVLVCGGAVSAGSSTLADFLEEVCRRPVGATPPPQIALLSSREPDPALRTLLRKKWAQRHVTLLLGSVLDQRDLARARAESATMAFVLANLTAADVDAEDEETVLAAAALKRAVPGLPVRVLLARQASRKMAAAAGLPPHACLAASEVAPRLLALGVRCPGSVALFINAIRSTPLSVPKGAEQPWHREYIHGASQQLHGAALGPPTGAEALASNGRTFGSLARRLKQDWDIALVGVQKQGVVALNPPPGVELAEGDVVFALASDEGTLRRACRSPQGDAWKVTFHRKRDDADLRAARALLGGGARRGRGESAAVGAHHGASSGTASPLAAAAAAAAASPGAAAGGSGRGRDGFGRWFHHRRWLALPPRSAAAGVTARDSDPLSPAEEAADEAAAEAAAAAGSHLLVITPGGGDWAQVRELLVALRCRAFPLPMPVVLFSPEVAPRSLLRLGCAVHALRGELKDTKALLRAGLATAACTLYSAGDPAPTANPEMIDRRAVLAARILERAAAAAGRDAAVFSEMHTPESLRYLPETALEAKPWAAAAAELAGRKMRCALGPLAARLLGGASSAGGIAGALAAAAPAAASSAPSSCGGEPHPNGDTHSHSHHHHAHRRLTPAEQEKKAADQLAALAALAVARPSPYLHARYAAGRAAFRTDASRLFGHVFFTPGVFELFAALVDPLAEEQQQSSLLWIVPMPEGCAGKSYAELCEALLQQGVLALGLFRQAGSGRGRKVPAAGVTPAAAATGSLPFVFTNPPGWLPLRRSDGVYALAPPEWCGSRSSDAA